MKFSALSLILLFKGGALWQKKFDNLCYRIPEIKYAIKKLKI